MTRKVAVLGSTGSIGTQALEIIHANPELELHSLLCNSNLDLLLRQRVQYAPSVTAIASPGGECPDGIITGQEILHKAIDGADMVLNAIVGSAGLQASLICRDRGITLALANKESLVVGGSLLRDHIRCGGIIPVDSEHSTIFRCLNLETHPVRSITLTASGGSARDIPVEKLQTAGVDDILNHPTWDMGARITVDSATMVNKAFEVIEARWLFEGLQIDVVLHPQSIVHSLVRLADGSWKALMGKPDMKIPLQYALQYPNRELGLISDDCPLDWGTLEFSELDGRRYPAFDMVVRAGQDGKSWPAAANAADEVAVAAFLDRRISFGDIAIVIEEVLTGHEALEISDFQTVMRADRDSRIQAERIVRKLC
ncbi:MAG: 1-deoxy-D-xylulose-5-phosphate reductoisomerase [Candidatus Aegiribacteria sp.]|nr:1-deoxy-D-xylulose-5-phosphate reductoisomerase [Candidatus Aegiribacteria sp.]